MKYLIIPVTIDGNIPHQCFGIGSARLETSEPLKYMYSVIARALADPSIFKVHVLFESGKYDKILTITYKGTDLIVSDRDTGIEYPYSYFTTLVDLLIDQEKINL